MNKILLITSLMLFISCQSDDSSPQKEEVLLAEDVFSEETLDKLKLVSIQKENLDNGIQKVSVTDLYAKMEDKNNTQKGLYLKFNLEKASWVIGDDWDIAFYNRSIVFNGGVPVIAAPYSVSEPDRTGDVKAVVMGKLSAEDEAKEQNLVAIAQETDGDFLNVKEVPSDLVLKQDKRGEFVIDDSSKGMTEYNFSPLEHIVTIKKNRFLIIKTRNGHYVKLKLKSLYEGGGKTAEESTEMDMNVVIGKIYPFYTFSYYINTKKEDKKLQ